MKKLTLLSLFALLIGCSDQAPTPQTYCFDFTECGDTVVCFDQEVYDAIALQCEYSISPIRDCVCGEMGL